MTTETAILAFAVLVMLALGVACFWSGKPPIVRDEKPLPFPSVKEKRRKP